jgi:hypothetical protein
LGKEEVEVIVVILHLIATAELKIEHLDRGFIRPLSITISKYLILSTLQRKEACFIHNFGEWKIHIPWHWLW